MIVLPTRGIAGRQRAVTQHQIDIDVFGDWIEASVLLGECDHSVTDVVDVLLGEELYEDQDFARDITQAAWLEIERRVRLAGSGYGLIVQGEWVKKAPSDLSTAPHLFLLLLSLATQYDWWHRAFGSDYTEQGRLFEAITEVAVAALCTGWETFATGWRASGDRELLEIAQEVANRINTGPIIRPEWNTRDAKDLTLDILLHFPVQDGRQGAPYYLIQCASGGNWRNKLKEPDTDQWRKILNPDVLPVRGLSVPFCLLDEQFRFASTRCAGFLLDRCRLLGAAEKKPDLISSQIQTRLESWMEPRIKGILQRSS